MVEVAPGKNTSHADFKVGAGLMVHGVVRNAAGAVVPDVSVSADESRTVKPAETDKNGRFALRITTAGRHLLRVAHSRMAGSPYEPLRAVVLDVDRLDGERNGVELVIGDELPLPGGTLVRTLRGASARAGPAMRRASCTRQWRTRG